MIAFLKRLFKGKKNKRGDSQKPRFVLQDQMFKSIKVKVVTNESLITFGEELCERY